MNKLFVMTWLLFVMTLVSRWFVLKYMDNCFQQGQIIGFFIGAFFIFFIAFCRDWYNKKTKKEVKQNGNN